MKDRKRKIRQDNRMKIFIKENGQMIRFCNPVFSTYDKAMGKNIFI